MHYLKFFPLTAITLALGMFAGRSQSEIAKTSSDFEMNTSKTNYAVQRATPQLEFTTATSGGSGEPNLIRLLVASDFGEPTAKSVKKASWTDITDRATWAPTSKSTSSGVIDLSDIANSLKQPVRFAFKYESPSRSDFRHPIWSIRTFDLSLLAPIGTSSDLASLTTAEWTVVDVKNKNGTWVISKNQLRIDGGTKNTPDQEDWVVSEPFNLLSAK